MFKRFIATVAGVVLVCAASMSFAEEGKLESAHFIVSYNVNFSAVEGGKVGRYAELKQAVVEKSKTLRSKYPDTTSAMSHAFMEVYAQFVSDNLEQDYRNYEAAGFKMPATKIPVTLKFGDADAEYQPGLFNSNIDIFTTYGSIAELKHDMGHELFHAIQNQYMNAKSLSFRRWVVEASADYASNTIALGGKGSKMGEGITQSFIKKSITYSPSNIDRHQYHAAYFIDYLNKSGVPFKTLWENLMSYPTEFDTLSPIENTVAMTQKTDLLTVYSKFVEYLLFSPSSPVPGKTYSERDPMSNGLAESTTFRPKGLSLTAVQVVSPMYSANVWGIHYVETDKSKAASRLVSLTCDTLSGKAQVNVYQAGTSGVPVQAGTLTEGSKTLVFPVNGANKFYVVAVNGDVSEKTFHYIFSDATLNLTVTPKELKNQEPAQDITYSFVLQNIPKEIKSLKYMLSYGDGTPLEQAEEAVNITTSAPSINMVKHHNYAKGGKYTGNIVFQKMTPKGAVTLAQDTFTAEVKNASAALALVPERMNIKTGESVAFSVTGAVDPLKVSALWDFGDGFVFNGNGIKGSHLYGKVGSYKVALKLTDKSTGKILGNFNSLINVAAKDGTPASTPVSPVQPTVPTQTNKVFQQSNVQSAPTVLYPSYNYQKPQLASETNGIVISTESIATQAGLGNSPDSFVKARYNWPTLPTTLKPSSVIHIGFNMEPLVYKNPRVVFYTDVTMEYLDGNGKVVLTESTERYSVAKTGIYTGNFSKTILSQAAVEQMKIKTLRFTIKNIQDMAGATTTVTYNLQ